MAQALGYVDNQSDDLERGRLYLEKIVQYQIPIPITLRSELEALLNAELSLLEEQSLVPQGWKEIERFESLLQLVVPGLIGTPRDIRRLVGTFHVLASMIGREVDWLDLLGFSILHVKAPGTIQRIKANPEMIIEDPVSVRASIARMSDENRSLEERLGEFVPETEHSGPVSSTLGHLFPYFAGERGGTTPAIDAIRYRRQLLTVLRLGILPGTFSRSDIEKFVSHSQSEMCAQFTEMYNNDTLANFLDRLDDLYSDVVIGSDHRFWNSGIDFLRKPNNEWMTQYSTMHEMGRAFADIFGRQVYLREEFANIAHEIFFELVSKDDLALVPYLLRVHVFAHGLFNREEREEHGAFLEKDEALDVITHLSRQWQERHLTEPRWVARLWGLQPVYTMIDTGDWDAECRGRLHASLDDESAVVALTLMMFGSFYTTEKQTVSKIIGLDTYLPKLEELNRKASSLHETARVSVSKALRELGRAEDSES